MNLSIHLVRRVALFWALCWIAVLGAAQNANNLGQQSWSTENGLPQNSVHQIFQSSDGYIWIATEGGAARFNGIDFKVFNRETNPSFTSDDICCFAQDSAGLLWIGTADGLLEYSEGEIHRFSPPARSPNQSITSLAIAGTNVPLILAGDGVSILESGHLSPLSLPNSAVPLALATAADGSVWISSDSGIFQYRPGHALTRSIGTGAQITNIEDMGFLHDHTPWFTTTGTLSIVRNGNTTTIHTGKELSASRIQSILEDARGGFWIGTDKGLFLVDSPGSRPKLEPLLGINSILSLMQDREGNLWVGTETSGLHVLRQQSFRTIPGLSDHVVTAVTQASDSVMWIGTNGDGLYRWQAGNLQHFSTVNGLLSEVVLALAPGTNGDIWVGTPDGLNHIKGSTVHAYTSADGLPDDLVRSLLHGGDGSLWIGTRRGIVHWKNDRFVTLTKTDGLKSDLIGSLLQSSPRDSPDDLWIGTLDGLSHLRDGKITTFTRKDGLSGDTITALAEGAQGKVWIGTKGEGLSMWSSNSFTSFRRDDLPQSVDSIIEDSLGNLWLSSIRGVVRVSASALIACGASASCNPHPVSFGRLDGMATEETSSIGHPAAWRTTDGTLWFATRKGVAITDPAHLANNQIPPSVVIERFTADNVDLPVSQSGQEIGLGRSSLAIQYTGLSFIAPSKVRYRYILEGFDKEWTEAGSRRIAYYTNLPPGHYRFRIQAANNDGIWNQTGAQFSFSVRPPFYRKLWFFFFAFSLISAIVFLIYRLRVRGLQSQFQAVLAERNRVAREIHDTLAQSFVGVSIQLELTAQLLAQSKMSAAGEQINSTRKYVRDGLAEARRSIWDLRAATTQQALPTRITQFAEQRKTEQLAIQLHIGGTYRPLAPAFEDEILRIAQESLMNVSRHANATQASVDLRYYPNRLTLKISDNGRGFKVADHSLSTNGHFGLSGLRERAAQIKAHLTIESSQGMGTTVELDAPIVAEKGNAEYD